MNSLRPTTRVVLSLAAGALLGLAACSKGTEPPKATDAGHPPVVGLASNSTDAKGQPAHFEYSLTDVSGAKVDLASFRGKPLVINFWATWCPPCKLEIPWFVELKKQYGPSGLEIVGVSIDDEAADLAPFITEYKINYPVLLGKDQDKMIETYEAEASIPVTWFIRRDGTVQARNIGIEGRDYFETQIKALF